MTTLFTIANKPTGLDFDFDWAKLTDEVQIHLGQYGARESIADSYASATKDKFPDDAERLAEQRRLARARWDDLVNGRVPKGRRSGIGISETAKALLKAAGDATPDDVAEAMALLRAHRAGTTESPPAPVTPPAAGPVSEAVDNAGGLVKAPDPAAVERVAERVRNRRRSA